MPNFTIDYYYTWKHHHLAFPPPPEKKSLKSPTHPIRNQRVDNITAAVKKQIRNLGNQGIV